MKYPVLTRLFSIALAIVSLIMLMAGALGIRSAGKDRRETLADYDRLQGRIGEYDTVTQALEGTISYEEANKALQELQDQHESDASQHKNDLALYSATKGGVSTGADAIEEGEKAIQKAWDQYDAGLAALLEQEEKLEQGAQALEELTLLSQDVQAGMQSVLNRTLTPFPEAVQAPAGSPEDGEGEDVDPAASVIAAETPAALGEGTPGEDGGDTDSGDPGNGEPSGGDPGGETDPGGGDSGTEEPDSGDAGDGELNGGDPGGETGPSGGDTVFVVSKKEILDAYGNLLGAYEELGTLLTNTTGLLGGLSAMDGLPEEQKAQIDGILSQMTGLGNMIQGSLNSLQEAVDTLGEIPEDMIPETVVQQYGLKTGYNAAKGSYSLIQGILSKSTGMLSGLNQTLAGSQAELDQGRAAIAAAKEQLAQARAALEAGDAQLYSGWAQLQKTLDDLEKQAGDLQQEKANLEQESQELAAQEKAVQQQKDLEKRQTSLKVLLLDWDGIQERVDGGMELLDSARAYGEQMLRDADREYRTRLIACVLMLVGGAAGLAGIPAAFEKLKRRVLLLAPVILCLVCAAGAEYLLVTMGRGISYSALFTGIFALMQLLVTLPKAKKPGQA